MNEICIVEDYKKNGYEQTGLAFKILENCTDLVGAMEQAVIIGQLPTKSVDICIKYTLIILM